MVSLKTLQYHNQYFNKKIIMELNLLEGKNSYRNLTINISIDKERKIGLDILGTIEVLQSLNEAAKQAKTQQGKDFKVKPKFIIFVNNLAAFYSFFRTILKVVHNSSYDLCGTTISEMMIFTTEYFEFRDLYSAAGANSLEDFYSGAEEENCPMDAYENWLYARLKDLNLADIKYSRVYGDIKIFRKENAEIVKLMNTLVKDFVPPIQYYFDLVWKVSHGDVGVMYSNKMFENELCEDVISIDRKSYFPFFFITEKFPLGEFIEINKIDEKMIENWLENGSHFEIEIEMEYCEAYYTGMPQYPHIKREKDRVLWFGDENDYRLLKEFYHYKINKINYGHLCRESRKLPLSYRNLLMEQFNLKETLEKGSPEQIKVKRALNSQIGKSIQRVFYPTHLTVVDGEIREDLDTKIPNFTQKDLQKALTSKSRYLLPQWGTRVYSAARLKMFRTCKKIIENGGEILYIDTDSIKFFCYGDREPLLEIIEEENREAALAIGNDSGLGNWKIEHEFKYFRYFGIKTYVGEEADGKRTYAFAGLKKSVAEKFFRAINIEKITKSIINIPAEYKCKRIIKYDYKIGVVWFNYASYSLNELGTSILLGLAKMKTAG